MRLLVVLSQVNYMPENYNGILQGLISAFIEEHKKDGQKIEIVGCASLKTLDSSLLLSLLKLPLIGVYDLPKQIIRNIFSTLQRKRELICEEASIQHLQWNSMNDEASIKWVNQNKIDLILNLRTRCIYKKSILNSPKLGCINIHHGILPKYRGTFCDLYALFANRPAGFSIHKMAKKVDAGEIYHTQVVDPGLEKNYSLYLKKTIPLEVECLTSFLKNCVRTVPAMLPKGIVNSESMPSYTKNPTLKVIKQFKEEGMIL